MYEHRAEGPHHGASLLAAFTVGENDMAVNDEATTDYGYDLAHEMKNVVLPSPRRSLPASFGKIGRELDPSSDFGYDQAHEI